MFYTLTSGMKSHPASAGIYMCAAIMPVTVGHVDVALTRL